MRPRTTVEPSFPEVGRPDVVDCLGVDLRGCLQIKESEDAYWESFYSGIKGFIHTEGLSYILEVEVAEVEAPPADGI